MPTRRAICGTRTIRSVASNFIFLSKATSLSLSLLGGVIDSETHGCVAGSRGRARARLSRPCTCHDMLSTERTRLTLHLRSMVSPEESWNLTVQPRVNALIRSNAEPRLQLGCPGLLSPFCVYQGILGRRPDSQRRQLH